MRVLFRLPTGCLSRLALLAVGTVLALGLVEFGLRWLLPQNLVRLPVSIWTRDAELDWRFASDLDLVVNTGERPVRFVTDENGYRVRPGRAAEPTRRILAIGDSFVVAQQVEYEETFAALLAGLVSERLDSPIGVLNAGAGGWNPNHYRLIAERELGREEFEAVLVVLYSGNDIVDSRYMPGGLATAAEAQPNRPTLHQRMFGTVYSANDWLEQRSHAFKFFRDRAQFLRIRLGLSAHYIPFGFMVANAESPAWGVTADLCAEIAETAAARDTPVLFVLLPSLHQVDRALGEKYQRAFGIAPEELDLDQPSRLLRGEFAARGLDLVDLTAAMWRLQREEGVRLYGEVDTHLSPEGHRVVARLLERRVVELLE